LQELIRIIKTEWIEKNGKILNSFILAPFKILKIKNY